VCTTAENRAVNWESAGVIGSRGMDLGQLL